MRASCNQGGYSVAYFSLVGFSSAAKACTVEIKPAAIRAARLFTCETECGDLADVQTRLKGACPVRDTPGARSSCARPVTCDIEISPSVAWFHNSLNKFQSRSAHKTCALRHGTQLYVDACVTKTMDLQKLVSERAEPIPTTT